MPAPPIGSNTLRAGFTDISLEHPQIGAQSGTARAVGRSPAVDAEGWYIPPVPAPLLSLARGALAGLAALGAVSCGGGKPGARAVVLVTLDTTRADHLGCYGDERAATPQLDGLA